MTAESVHIYLLYHPHCLCVSVLSHYRHLLLCVTIHQLSHCRRSISVSVFRYTSYHTVVAASTCLCDHIQMITLSSMLHCLGVTICQVSHCCRFFTVSVWSHSNDHTVINSSLSRCDHIRMLTLYSLLYCLCETIYQLAHCRLFFNVSLWSYFIYLTVVATSLCLFGHTPIIAVSSPLSVSLCDDTQIITLFASWTEGIPVITLSWQLSFR